MFDTTTGEEFEPETRFDEMLDECHPEVEVAGIAFAPSDVLRSCDPIVYRVALSDYESDQIDQGEWSEADPSDSDDEED